MFSSGQRVLLRNGKSAQFVRPDLRLGGEIIEVTPEGGSTHVVNANDLLVADPLSRTATIARSIRRVDVPLDWTITLPPTLPVGAGFPNAVRRFYQIGPVGASGFVASLRLHYRDGELNGNSEGALKL